MEEIFFLLTIICCFVTGHISKKGSRSYILGFLNSFFLAAIGVATIAVISFFSIDGTPNTETAIVGGYIGLALSIAMAYSTRKKTTCGYCAEEIKPEAKVCKHCGRNITN